MPAALLVFGKKGFAATCVGDVADAAKIAKGTVYLYFDSKEEIYATAVQMAVAQLQGVAAERIRLVSGVRERLAVAIAVRMEFWHEQLNLYRLLLTVGREARHKRQTHEVLRSGHAYFLSILQESEAVGELKARDLDTIAWAITGYDSRLQRAADGSPDGAHSAAGCGGDYGVRAAAVRAGE